MILFLQTQITLISYLSYKGSNIPQLFPLSIERKDRVVFVSGFPMMQSDKLIKYSVKYVFETALFFLFVSSFVFFIQLNISSSVFNIVRSIPSEQIIFLNSGVLFHSPITRLIIILFATNVNICRNIE